MTDCMHHSTFQCGNFLQSPLRFTIWLLTQSSAAAEESSTRRTLGLMPTQGPNIAHAITQLVPGRLSLRKHWLRRRYAVKDECRFLWSIILQAKDQDNNVTVDQTKYGDGLIRIKIFGSYVFNSCQSLTFPKVPEFVGWRIGWGQQVLFVTNALMLWDIIRKTLPTL